MIIYAKTVGGGETMNVGLLQPLKIEGKPADLWLRAHFYVNTLKRKQEKSHMTCCWEVSRPAARVGGGSGGASCIISGLLINEVL